MPTWRPLSKTDVIAGENDIATNTSSERPLFADRSSAAMKPSAVITTVGP